MQLMIDEMADALASLRELDVWNSIDSDDDWANVPDDQWANAWQRHMHARGIEIADWSFGELCISPKLNDHGTAFDRNVAWIEFTQTGPLAYEHRESVERVVKRILDAYSPGWWDIDFDDIFSQGWGYAYAA
ncbi:hypothetical protein K227x_26410 [Rubripirellula lacrimiformis]|uniref:Uncharacterized protein n=1 Tax=Rubripirellula lacrimiformis TaxID=1930273 RepID=A0A517NAU5_9BACT|nr:hypothetical protein [Rubripirellula lacrimiformis]QDT04251.1 hypothetical protein K227x_26410 [Rubripirellula lacrimiformis]